MEGSDYETDIILLYSWISSGILCQQVVMKHRVEGSTKGLWIMVFHILIQLGVSCWPSNGLDYLQLVVGTIG